MDEEMPYWYKLILGWVAKGHDGLTIPFILGAERHINGTGEFNNDEIINLLLEIQSSSFEKHIITFYHCDKIDEEVLGLFSKLNANHYNGLKFLNDRTCQISFAIANDLKLGDTIEEISSNLTDDYKKLMQKGNFSKYGKSAWGPLTTDEKQFIEESLSIDS